MSYFYTKVPTNFSPDTLFTVSNTITLKPAIRTSFESYNAPGATMFFDTMFFITNAGDVKEHIALLKEWVIFHAFLFDFHHIIHFFESGMLKEHREAESIEEIAEDGDSNGYKIDYANIGSAVYFPHATTPKLEYSSLFTQFSQLTEKEKRMVKNSVLRLKVLDYANLLGYQLFADETDHWQIASDVVLLEGIIGHDSHNHSFTCSEPGCSRTVSHRIKSEAKWREDYLAGIGVETQIRDEYIQVIATAYNEIRNKTAHPGMVDLPEYPVIEDSDSYDVARSTVEFGSDKFALENLVIMTHDVVRYLLLNNLFSLSVFPKLRKLNVVHIGSK